MLSRNADSQKRGKTKNYVTISYKPHVQRYWEPIQYNNVTTSIISCTRGDETVLEGDNLD